MGNDLVLDSIDNKDHHNTYHRLKIITKLTAEVETTIVARNVAVRTDEQLSERNGTLSPAD